MLEIYYQHRRVLKRLRSGALGKEMDHIAAQLSQLGYTRLSAKIYLSKIARFSAFAAKVTGYNRGRSKIGLDVVERFVNGKPTLSSRISHRSSLSLAMKMVPQRFQTLSARRKVSSDDRLLARYEVYLFEVRGLQAKTVEGDVLVARRMLSWIHKHKPRRALGQLTGQQVLALTYDFLSAQDNEYTRSSTTAYIRSFLRYLQWADLNNRHLARFVPRTPCYRLAHLTPRVGWKDVRAAIDSIDISNATGVRDRALLLLIATTGIRNAEARRLELEDVHWERGEVLIRQNKTGRDRVVPLLQVTGAALSRYVLKARRKSCSSRVFLTQVPPVRPLGCSGSISRIVRQRLEQGNVHLPGRAGAHLLRHCLATRLVSQARPINEVSDLLGHRHIDTTSVYIKVALPQLAAVALPFPEGAP